jgi:glucan phosphoethanolaminetransferase (alkaline phosphatase superfamily)
MLYTLWGERSQTDTAAYYTREIVRNGLFILGVSAVLLARPTVYLSLSKRWALVPVVAVAAVTAIINYTHGGTQVFPIPNAFISNMISMSLSPANRSEVYPLAADIEPTRPMGVVGPTKSGIDRIIMIMDESVRGDYLSINNPQISTTPLLANNGDIINFGVAVSGANCSTFSRMMFRFGMKSGEVSNWRAALKNPTMWEYAKRAGYQTIYIDTFVGPCLYLNGVSSLEKRQIDQKLTVLDKPTYLRDHKLVDVIAGVLRNNNEKLFLYVDKFGTHVPYENKYPPNDARYRSIDGSEQDIVKNQYKNAISWSVDEFFAELKKYVNLQNTLLIYTSDHGQSLYDGGYKQSHCTVDGPVVPSEGYVPLFAMTHVDHYERGLRQAAASGRNHFSHFEIFPTLLNAMGYDASWTKERYGQSLLEAPNILGRGFYVGDPRGGIRKIAVDANRDQ